MDDTSAAEDQKRYVPAGVDARSWAGFEHRIQERRYRALIAQIDAAVLRRDGIAAMLAFEEARELRPDAPELIELSEQIASIPLAPPPASTERFVWSRAMNAVSMLAAGVALLVAIEWVHPPRPLPSSHTASTVVVTPPPVLAAAEPAPTAGSPPATSSDSVTSSAEPDVALPDPVATSGVQPAINVARPAVGGPATPTFPQAVIDTEVQNSAREVPDDDAPADARGARETNAGAVETAPVASASADTAAREQPKLADEPRDVRDPVQEAAPPAPTLLTSVAPARTPIALMPPTAPPASSSVATIEVRPRVPEEARVAQVLDSYARAYAQLDVQAARKVWPTVDERALARAFASLQSQDVSFDNCNVSVSGAKATASCRGRATYVGKIGSRDRRTEARQWTFELRRDANDGWEIERAQAQRMQ
jgi:hypothetical protein